MIMFIDNVALGAASNIAKTSWYIYNTPELSVAGPAIWSNLNNTSDLLATFIPDIYQGNYGYAVVTFDDGTTEEVKLGVINDLTTLPRGTIESYVERPRLEIATSTLTSNAGQISIKTYPIYPSSNTLLKTVCIVYCNGNICAIEEEESDTVTIPRSRVVPFEEGDEIVVEVAHVNINGVTSDFTRKVIQDMSFSVTPLFITTRMDPSDDIEIKFTQTLTYFNLVTIDGENIYSSINTADISLLPRHTLRYGSHYVIQAYFDVGGENHMRTFPITSLSNNLISLDGEEFLNRRLEFKGTTDFTTYADMYLEEGDNGFTLLVDPVERQKLLVVHLDSGNVIGEYSDIIAFPVMSQRQVSFLSNSIVLFMYDTTLNGTIIDLYLLKDVSGQIMRHESIQLDTISHVTTNKAGYFYYVDSSFILIKGNGYDTQSSSVVLDLTTIPGLIITNENVQINFSDIDNIIIQGSTSHIISVDVSTGKYLLLKEKTASIIGNYSFTDGVGNSVTIEKSTGNITKFNPYLETEEDFVGTSPVKTVIRRRDAGAVIVDGEGTHIIY